MVMNYLEGELRKTNDPGDKGRANIIRIMRTARGSDISLPTPELNLENEWSRQTREYIKLGFHEERGLSEQKYLDSLPKFGPQPENFKGRFDIPVIVETRISVKRQCELAGIDYLLGAWPHVDWPLDPKDYKTPNVPYITCMQDGAKNLKKGVDAVRGKLAKNERGATNFDGIAFYLAQPEVLKHHSIDLPGTEVSSDLAPYLSLENGQPKLDYRGVDHPDPRCGSVTCGRS